jgi:hypothetical protein
VTVLEPRLLRIPGLCSESARSRCWPPLTGCHKPLELLPADWDVGYVKFYILSLLQAHVAILECLETSRHRLSRLDSLALAPLYIETVLRSALVFERRYLVGPKAVFSVRL